MIFGLSIILIFSGLILAGIPGLCPIKLPTELSFLFFLFGVVLSMAGLSILWTRAHKIGADKLIAPARPGCPLWVYIYDDGEVRLFDSVRKGEGYLFSSDLDALIPDVKTYSWADHKIRFVPEGAAHAVDLAVVEYTQIMDSKQTFQGLRDARQKIFAKLERNPPEDIPEDGISSENVYPQLRSR